MSAATSEGEGARASSAPSSPVRSSSPLSFIRNSRRASACEDPPSGEDSLDIQFLNACLTEDEMAIWSLLKKGANVNARDPSGRTGLSHACAGGHSAIVNEILRHQRVDVNLADNEGNTPLHYAAQAGHIEAVEALIAKPGINLDLRNELGITPLIKAAINGRTKVARSLHGAGANIHLRDYGRGFKASEWAKFCGRHLCAEVLMEGAHTNPKGSGSSRPTIPTPPSGNALDKRRGSSGSTVGQSWLGQKLRGALKGSKGGSPQETLSSGGGGRRFSIPLVSVTPDEMQNCTNRAKTLWKHK